MLVMYFIDKLCLSSYLRMNTNVDMVLLREAIVVLGS